MSLRATGGSEAIFSQRQVDILIITILFANLVTKSRAGRHDIGIIPSLRVLII